MRHKNALRMVAQLLNTHEDEFTPENFSKVYKNILDNLKKAAEEKPEAEAELEIAATGRKLASVTARFASAALRIFGI